jgi:GTP-binding protein
MSKIPLVAVIGRPNVGKSTFLNTIVGRTVSIVGAEAGVTRDRIYADAEWCGHNFSLIDTGGLDFDEGKNAFSAHIKEQVDIAIELSDCIVFLLDGQAGVTPADLDIARSLRRAKKPVIVTVNKVDNERIQNETLYDFYKLDLGDPIPISCAQKTGLGELLDAIIAKIPASQIKSGPSIPSPDGDVRKRIAVVGKPNAGKSSIVNRLLGEKRVMVSAVAGTTRDSIDTAFRYNGREYILTDTAGIRRKRSIEAETVEQYSVVRALAAVRNADVCVLVIDANEGLTEQDVRLAGYIDEMGKPSVICINKWDSVAQPQSATKDKSNSRLPLNSDAENNADKAKLYKDFNKALAEALAFMPYFKAIFISALTGQRMGEVMRTVEYVLERTEARVTTGVLNDLITGFTATTPPPFIGGKRAKILYCTQVSIAPPTFALFVNNKDIVPETYLRYIENSLRRSVDLTGTPIRLLLRNRSKKDE